MTDKFSNKDNEQNVKHSCIECSYCDGIQNICILTNKKVYENGKQLVENCNKYTEQYNWIPM